MKFDISIIIPCYNACSFIEQLSNCIGNQILGEGNLEFILVDDGSTDNTLACLENVRATYPQNVKVISKSNGGVASARNTGIVAASGEWIGFLDSDDLFAPGSLQYLYDNCISPEFDMVEFKEKILPSTPQQFEPLTNRVLSEQDTIMYYSTSTTIVVWKLLYKRDYINKNNIRFRDLKIGEDCLFNFDACMAGGRIRCVDTVVTYHIDRPGSLTTSSNSKYVRTIISSVMYAQRVFTDYLNNHKVSDAISTKIRMHKERQIRFVFSKIIVTSDFSTSDINEIKNQFKSYGAFPIAAAKGKDKLINILYNHPWLLKLYGRLYVILKSIKH